MKSKIDIILETQSAYADPHNTAFAPIQGMEQRCVITTIDGRHCAVGRCMTEQSQQKYLNSVGPSIGFGDMDEPMLKPEYRGHSGEFWLAIQRFHDAIAKGSPVEVIEQYWDDLFDYHDLETIPSLSEQADLQ